ncbi:MAG: flagellar hook-length control protein FliK, partial [Lachnospiraceae bacterium]|nr:flagellar hook-length control protein FliK [Lachnospiraceae bacterium]
GYSVMKESYNRRDVLDEDRQNEFEKIIEEMPDNLIDEETMKKQCQRADKYMEDILSESYKSDSMDTVGLEKLRAFGRSLNLNRALVGRRSYEIPIIAGDEIRTMNVTILEGMDDGGKVQIDMDDEGGIGKVSARFKVSADNLKGLILCDSREGYERITEGQESFESAMADEGFNIKNISVSMMHTSNEMSDINIGQYRADTSKLYKAAKAAVKYISSIMN